MNLKELLLICTMDQKVSIHLGSLKSDFYLRGIKEEILKSGSTITYLSGKDVKEIKAENNVLKVSLL